MSQPNATFGIDITANDKTAKGRKSAEKNIGLIPKHAGAASRRLADQQDRDMVRRSRGLLRTFGKVEQASARIFGGRSLTKGVAGRLSAVREAAAAAGEGFGEAATAGSLLQGAMGAVGVAAGATVGVLAAAAYGAYKLADGWAKGAASIGRTAEIIGVASKQLQEFNAAAELQGVDKGTATSAIGGLSQSLNDARYGRNNDAVALLSRLGVKLQLNPDGTVNTGAMLPAIADALARQNSSGRRTAARILGIPDAALPAFTQGGAALGADMTDADNTAYIASAGDIATAKRIQRKQAIVGQMKDRAVAVAGAATAQGGEGALDATISAGRGIISGTASFGGVVRSTFAPAAEKIAHAAERIWDAASRGASEIGHGIIGAAQAAQRNWGIPASISLAQYDLESAGGRRMPAGSNNPFGIKARDGEPFVIARTREEDRFGRSHWVNAKFRKFGSIEEAFDAHAQLLASGRYANARRSLPNTDAFADALTGVYATDHNYGRKLKNIIHREGLSRFDEIPVRVEVHLVNAPHGTRAKVTAGRGKPAVSHAMAS